MKSVATVKPSMGFVAFGWDGESGSTGGNDRNANRRADKSATAHDLDDAPQIRDVHERALGEYHEVGTLASDRAR